MVSNGYMVPPVVYEPFNYFVGSTELPTTGREVSAAMPDSNWYLASIWVMWGTAGGAACTLKWRKITDNSAPNAGAGATVVELTGVGGATPYDATQAARVWREVPLIKNVAARTFRSMQRLAVVSAGTVTPLADVVTIIKWLRVN